MESRHGLDARVSGSGAYGRAMTESTDDPRISQRADLSPEEQAAGSADPTAQARLILEESDERTEHSERDADGSELDPDRHH